MWEAIKEVLNGTNSMQTLMFLLAVVVLVFVLIKGEYLRIKTAHVKIGTDEQERAILRQQKEWTYQYVSGLFGAIKTKYPKVEPMKTKYILELIYDEIITWILFNHITRSDMYVMVKQEKLRGIVLSMDVAEPIHSDEFKILMDGWTKEIINRLVDIREYYNRR